MSEPELKPCPFCGSKAIYVAGSCSEMFWVRCTRCEAGTYLLKTRQEVIGKWNSRHDPEQAGNRKPDRYALPPELGNRDTTMWVVGKPFFLASAIKYIWRGWDHADDLRKALQCLELAYIHEVEQGAAFSLMWSDLRQIKRHGDKETALSALAVEPRPDRTTIRGCSELVSKRVKELEGGKGERT